jgi:hypothetical protein
MRDCDPNSARILEVQILYCCEIFSHFKIPCFFLP